MHKLAKDGTRENTKKRQTKHYFLGMDKFSGGVHIEVEIGDSLVTITKSGAGRVLGKLDVILKGVFSQKLFLYFIKQD